MDPSYQLSHRYDGEEESDLMQDQVRRLTAIVREYQRRYMRINESVVEEAPLEPWMTDPSALSPLLIEYDNNIKSLHEQMRYYKEEFDVLQVKSKKIVAENTRLHHDLRQAIENQLNAIQHSDGLTNQNQNQLDQLQHKLKAINEEKIHAATLYAEANLANDNLKKNLNDKSQQVNSLNGELASLQDDLTKARSYAESIQNNNLRLKMENDRYLQSAQTQDEELDEVRQHNRKLTSEMKTQKLMNQDLQNHLNKLKEQMKYIDKDSMNTLSEKSVEGTLKRLQNENLELESRVISYSKEVNNLRFDKDDLEDQLGTLQRKNTALEENEYQAILRVRDSVQLVENALLEREQAIVQNQQKSQEVLRLQDALKNVVKQSDEQKKKEMQSLKEQSKKQIQQLMEDLHFYEIENGEKQAIWEKTLREKLSLEKELEKIYQERPMEESKVGCSIDELQKKLTKVELNRDESLMQIDSLQNVLRRTKSRLESDHNIMLNQVNDYKKQVKALKNDLEEVSESRVGLLEEVNTLKRELLSKREDHSSNNIAHASQISSLKQKLEVKEKEFETRVRVTEDTNKQAINEMREMMSLQQKNATKWREESRALCQKFESAISQLRQENSNLKEQNKNLQHSLNESFQKTEELEKDHYTNQVTLEKLQRLYSDSDERAEVASTQVQTLLSREKQLLHDRKTLNREVDKLKLDLSRPDRLNTSNQWNNYINEYRKEQL